MEGWKEALLAGLGGGALYGVVDGFLGRFLGGQAVFGGITLKDVATIFLSKWASEKVPQDWLRAMFKGAVVIGIYKVFYPQFVEPLIRQFLGGFVGGAPTPSPAPTTAPSPVDKARAYIATRSAYLMR